MSRLKELLNECCPEGVEYKTLGEMFVRQREKAKKHPEIKQVFSISNTMGFVRAEEFRENVVYSQDISNYTIVRKGMFAYNPSRLNIGSIAVNNLEDGLVSPMYVVFSIDANVLNEKYLMYLLKSPIVTSKIEALKESGARFRFDFERWGKISVPIPPLKVQQEIVQILDSFTELEAELETELAKRKQQYEYYRDQLLNFERERERVEWLSLQQICKVLDSERRPIAKLKRQDGCYPYYGANGIQDYIDDYIFDGDFILVGEDGSVVTEDGKPVVNWASGKIWVNNHAHIITAKDKTTLRYLYYYLQTVNIRKFIHGNIPKLTGGDFKTIKIPVPSRKTQENIVYILNIFNEFCNGTNSGLPVEIKARHQQFEYYRDKLLSF